MIITNDLNFFYNSFRVIFFDNRKKNAIIHFNNRNEESRDQTISNNYEQFEFLCSIF